VSAKKSFPGSESSQLRYDVSGLVELHSVAIL
jgi:hypothetical protein